MDDVSEGHQTGSVATAVDRATVVAGVAEALLSSGDLDAALAGLAREVVRGLADWCTVVTNDDQGGLRGAAVASADPAGEEAILALMDGTAPGAGPEGWAGPILTVPLAGRHGKVGALTLARGEYRDGYGPEELALAVEVARLGGLAVENAATRRSTEESEGRFRSFVDSLHAILWEADPSTLSFSFVSRRAEDLLGYPVQRWLEEPDFWAGKIHHADRDYTVSYRRVATAEGRDHELEYRMVAADGSKVWFQDLVYVDVGDDGAPRRLVGIMVDVTRRKRAEHVLWESRQRFASLARTLQESLLPPTLPEIPRLEVAARYRSAEGLDVVGDFYDLFEIGDGEWGVVMGDVCGKGAEAAALTALARHTARAAAMREPRPSGVLAQLNEAVLNHDAGERFCTAVYARIRPGPGSAALSLSCGGHPLPLVLRAGGRVESIGTPGTLLGLFEDADLADTAVALGPGDAAVFFTDGAIEAKRRRVLLGEDRLRAIVSTCTGLRAEEIVHRLDDAILAFQEESTPSDDLAIIVLRVPETAADEA